MARLQMLFVAVTLLLSPAVQVYGRVLPKDHEIERKDVKIPDKLKDEFPKHGNYAKFISNTHHQSKNGGEDEAHVTGHASGSRNRHETHAQGLGEIKTIESDGKGHGNAKASGKAGGFTKLGGTAAGGIIHGRSESHRDGDGKIVGDAFGSANDKRGKDETYADLKLDGEADGGHRGTSDNRATAASGGKVNRGTVSGLKGRIVADATNQAESEGDVHGFTHAVDRRGHGTDSSTASGVATGVVDSDANHGEAFGKGEAHGGSKAGKTFATIEIKGTGEAKNDDSAADGKGDAYATSSDKRGKDTSTTSATAEADADEDSRRGGAKGTGKAIADTGVKHKTAAHSDTKATVKTGSLNNVHGTTASTKAKHVAAIKNGHGKVSAHGTAKSSSEGDEGHAETYGGAHSERNGK